jgi:hypothetical protein
MIKNMIASPLLDFPFLFKTISKLAYLENLCHFGLDVKNSLQGDNFPQVPWYDKIII